MQPLSAQVCRPPRLTCLTDRSSRHSGYKVGCNWCKISIAGCSNDGNDNTSPRGSVGTKQSVDKIHNLSGMSAVCTKISMVCTRPVSIQAL